MSSMKQLSSDTIKLISSTQVITSVSSVVKELMENSIDAKATFVDIRLENYGLDKIEVHDNGVGISHNDVQVMCQRSYTSKIFDFSDLDKLTCYGFRGEALSSICAVADVTVITKSEFDQYAKSFTMDNNGRVINSSISHHQKGTIIKIVNLFKKLPVRKQIYSSKKYCVNDLCKIENVVKSLAAIQQNFRVSLVHNKSVVWQMTPVNDLTVTVGQIWSSSMTKYVKLLTYSSEQVKMDLVLPIQNIDVQNCFLTTTLADAIYLYVNKRPVRDNKIEKLIVEELSNYFGHYLPPGKYLPCLISINVPAETIDLNLEPDKSRILFHNQEMILLNLKNCINKHYYNDKVESDLLDTDKSITQPNKKRKRSCDPEENILLKPSIEISQINDFNFLKSECNNDDHTKIIKELSLDEIDFEEPFSTNENINNQIECFENTEMKNADDLNEYRKKLMNIGKNVSLQSMVSNNTNVMNFQAENISISQWSKGNVVINGKPLESGVKIKPDSYLQEISDTNIITEVKKASDILGNNHISESQKSELTDVENNVPATVEDKNLKKCSDISTTTSNVKLAPLFRMVSVSDEQVPGLKHLVNRPQSWVPQPRSKRPIPDTPEEDINETMRSVSSQMGNKEMSGFTLFAKEIRVKILQENPGMNFTKVSKELARSWSCLSNEDKEKYKKMANERKKGAISGTNDTKLPKKSFEFIFKNLKRHSTLINVELSEIKINLFERPKIISPEFVLIGKIQDNSWICCVRNEVRIVNVNRLQEAVVFFEKMTNDSIPLKILDQSIKISKKFLGENNYRFLLNLDNSYDPTNEKYIVKDEKIVKNGFNIVIIYNENLDADVLITDVALNISSYGAEELKQLMELMQMENNSNLYLCRPLKVVSYLRGETVRHCKITGLPKSKDEVHNLLDFWFKNETKFSHNSCIHYRDVFTPIHIID